jgi:hypothetical protein
MLLPAAAGSTRRRLTAAHTAQTGNKTTLSDLPAGSQEDPIRPYMLSVFSDLHRATYTYAIPTAVVLPHRQLRQQEWTGSKPPFPLETLPQEQLLHNGISPSCAHLHSWLPGQSLSPRPHLHPPPAYPALHLPCLLLLPLLLRLRLQWAVPDTEQQTWE